MRSSLSGKIAVHSVPSVNCCQFTCTSFPFGFNSFKNIRGKTAEFANSIDLNEEAHNEPPHLDLHCLPSSL